MNLALLAMPLMGYWLSPKLLSRLRLLAEARCGRLVRAAMGVLGSLCWGEPQYWSTYQCKAVLPHDEQEQQSHDGAAGFRN